MAEENRWKPDEDEEEELDETVRTWFHSPQLTSISLHIVLQGSQRCRDFCH